MIEDMVSVVMPTYNDARYLKSAINDILNQTYTNFELIIVNDGSTDRTVEILDSYAGQDKRIRVFHKENGGTGSALNHGFEQARGEFGTWVSSDDNKQSNYLEVLVEVLRNNRDIEFCCSAFYSAYLKKIFKPYHYRQEDNKFYFCNGIHHNDILTNKVHITDNWPKINNIQCFQGVCFMFTMRLKNKVGKYIQIPGEDYHMTMLMSLNSRVAYVDSNLGTHNNPIDSLSMQNRNCVSEANILTRKVYQESRKWNLEKIPKIANFYWGSKKMSFMRYMTIKTFKKQNPDWSIHLYVPKHVSSETTWRASDTHHKNDSTDYKAKEDYYFKLLSEESIKVIRVDFSNTIIGKDASEPHKSDFLRWNILYKSGGLWSDMDIIYYKPMTELYFNSLQNSSLDMAVCYDKRHVENGVNLTPIGFLLTKPRNPFFNSLTRRAIKEFNPNHYQSMGANMWMSNYPNVDSIQDSYHLRAIDFSHNVVYQFDWNNLDQIYSSRTEKLHDKSIGVHWYGGHPLSQNVNNQLNHTNYLTSDLPLIKLFLAK
jgi:glycosyltransferase involved in cell wall biosynthesis